MIISVTNLKGGVGKTTLAQNVAVYFAHKGKKVCLIDTDLDQKNCIEWAGLRAESPKDIPYIAVIGVGEQALTTEAKEQEKNYDVVIIDGRPLMGKALTKTLIVADFVLIPILPGATDIWAFNSFRERFEEVRAYKEDLTGFIIVNRFDRSNIQKEALEAMKGYDLGVMENTLASRIAYTEAMLEGLGVIEYKDRKAKEEVERVGEEIESIMQKKHGKNTD